MSVLKVPGSWNLLEYVFQDCKSGSLEKTLERYLFCFQIQVPCHLMDFLSIQKTVFPA